jgi:hypothetical protein
VRVNSFHNFLFGIIRCFSVLRNVLRGRCVGDAQMQLSAITEKERMVSDQLLEATTTLTSLKSQVSGLRQEKAQLLAQLEMERSKREMAEDAKNR